MTAALKWLSLLMGYACVAIGVFHMALGIDGIPDMGSAGATADSQSRFFGAIFLGYGLVWLWAARRDPVDTTAVRWLAGIFALGAVGRFISIAVYGWPHWFQLVLTAIEVVLPPVYFWLAAIQDQRTRATETAPLGAN
ncbi:DUF4345 domain-containing protein [Nocardia sp. NBC_01503]|uniref:DUF4345 domain-containing protein n=1 Tax=Nocardia sp. NBC_01503 TaxID=2975997 RepID=UPI002E7BC182|nr:DUF4345 domain-containing protein [Nocardia sp. NBC_01503]WTL29736.1 DUF4345 domain-containing protein [Nocardia sp. NBC_01503]